MCQKAIPTIKDPIKTYRADNAVDEATINLPDFLLVVVDPASPEGAFHGSSSDKDTVDNRNLFEGRELC